MNSSKTYANLAVTSNGNIFTVTLHRPPENFLDEEMLIELVDALEDLDGNDSCRVTILASEGKHFCAGANIAKRLADGQRRATHIYGHVPRLARIRKPIVACVQGAAVGAGLGLALMADFRAATAGSRFSANFNRQAYSPGFALTYTLPRVVGVQRASWLFYSGARIGGEEALRIGLIDRLSTSAHPGDAAVELATELALSGPLAVQGTRELLRQHFAARVEAAIAEEMALQDRLRETDDYVEGVQAMKERRLPNFQGR
ncbi:enoyl-CoA hydratase/isomerase family protein [Bordetella genomosp. 10]|uniref:enoyl-CoA hydratase/isomerase family protein n=1 Tax=Bordetella genomosp. 10 TaxID=1416804 RepID=UPI0015C65A08|nr:enoyl-CoA hydratase/isomerase family protein [Bordetella genomosp. 10]